MASSSAAAAGGDGGSDSKHSSPPPPPSPVFGERELKYMDLALAQAQLALENDEVPVGCIFVWRRPNNSAGNGSYGSGGGAEWTDQIIASAYNQTNISRNGSKHCELVAIDSITAAAANGSLSPPFDESNFRDCELFVTVEPCIMCAAALRIIGIGKVYFGAANDKFGGCGSVYSLHTPYTAASAADASAAAVSPPIESCLGYECVPGLRATAAIDILKQFYLRGNDKAPEAKRKRKPSAYNPNAPLPLKPQRQPNDQLI